MDLTQRTKERFIRAVEALEKAIALPPLPERARSVLLRFELTAELMPKLLGRMLAEQGRNVLLPKDSVRTALAAGFFDEETAEVLLHAIDDRKSDGPRLQRNLRRRALRANQGRLFACV